jgi:GNAT superfamily N-acetyltransferase
MPIITVKLQTPLRSTFRTEQIAGMFDLPREQLAERLAHTLTAELPEIGGNWTIGAIVGPSGSGKTTLARAAYGNAVYEPREWPEGEAIIDCLERSATGDRRSEVGDQKSGDLLVPTSDLRPLTSLKSLLHLLAAVGLASPPSWLRPYHTLSTGERFRAEVARAILQMRNSDCGLRNEELTAFTPHAEIRTPQFPLLVLDEFTSTLDRTTACTASLAISKYLRSSSSTPQSEIRTPQFIVLSCHTDFLPWLTPDWILDLTGNPRSTTNDKGPMTSDQGLRPFWPRGSLQRPPLRLVVRRVKQTLWPHFARHHYLTGGLASAATCYAAFCEADSEIRVQGSAGVKVCDLNPEPRTLNPPPIAFCAVLATLGAKRTKRITRLVVLPQFQGLGIASRLAEVVADHERSKGFRMTITASHPAIVAWCSRSPKWRYLGLKKTGSTRQQMGTRAIRCSTGRAVASFEYVG